jgi:hypothetical protein
VRCPDCVALFADPSYGIAPCPNGEYSNRRRPIEEKHFGERYEPAVAVIAIGLACSRICDSRLRVAFRRATNSDRSEARCRPLWVISGELPFFLPSRLCWLSSWSSLSRARPPAARPNRSDGPVDLAPFASSSGTDIVRPGNGQRYRWRGYSSIIGGTMRLA